MVQITQLGEQYKYHVIRNAFFFKRFLIFCFLFIILVLFVSLFFLIFPNVWYKLSVFIFSHFSVTKLGKSEMKLLENWRNFRKVRKHFSGCYNTQSCGGGGTLWVDVPPLFSYWCVRNAGEQELSSRLSPRYAGITGVFKEMEWALLFFECVIIKDSLFLL